MTVAVASTKPLHNTHEVAFAGAVDADGHILEPPDLWESYIDPKFRDRALRIVVDERGLEELEIDGRRSVMSRNGFPATLGAMGAPDLADMQKKPSRTYLRQSPFGAMDPYERNTASGLGVTTRCSPSPRTSACRSRYTRRSSRSGRRALAWVHGRT